MWLNKSSSFPAVGICALKKFCNEKWTSFTSPENKWEGFYKEMNFNWWNNSLYWMQNLIIMYCIWKKAQLRIWKVYSVSTVILRLICYLIDFSFKEAGSTTGFLSIVTFSSFPCFFFFFLFYPENTSLKFMHIVKLLYQAHIKTFISVIRESCQRPFPATADGRD